MKIKTAGILDTLKKCIDCDYFDKKNIDCTYNGICKDLEDETKEEKTCQ